MTVHSPIESDTLAPRAWAEFLMSPIAPTPEDFREFLTVAGIDPNQAKYSGLDLKLLIIRAMLQTQDEFFGHARQPMPIGTVELLVRVLNSGRTLMEGLEIVQRTCQKLLNRQCFAFRPSGDTYVIEMKLDGLDDEHSGCIELIALTLLVFAMHAFAGSNFRVERLLSRSKNYTGHRIYSPDCECPVEYAEFTGIELKTGLLDLPRRAAIDNYPLVNAIRWGLFADKTATSLKTDGRLRLEAEKILQDIEVKAKARNVSDRQKRRIAQEEGEYSLRDLKRSIRAAKAISMICTTNKTMAEIADDLEFSDDRAFRRFFRGTVGCTPIEYRQLYRSEGVAGDRDIFGIILDGVQQLV